MLLDTWGVVQYRLGNLEPSRDALERGLAHPRVRPGARTENGGIDPLVEGIPSLPLNSPTQAASIIAIQITFPGGERPGEYGISVGQAGQAGTAFPWNRE